MSRTQLNALLLLMILAVLGITLMLDRDPSKPNWVLFPDMAFSIPYNAYSGNSLFADGKTLQAPVPGTIGQKDSRILYGATPEEALRAGEELKNPFPAEDAIAQERGAVVFRNYCIVCHGGAGKGDGPVTSRGVPPPPPLDGENARGMKDGQMYHLITYGQGNMPAYASQVPEEDRWKAILHVRTLQPAQEANVDGEPSDGLVAKEVEPIPAGMTVEPGDNDGSASATLHDGSAEAVSGPGIAPTTGTLDADRKGDGQP